MRLSVGPRVFALGTNIQAGPFGGGNQFAQSFASYMRKQQIIVVHTLERSDIDVILVTSIKPWARGTAFDIVAALNYRNQHPHAKIILRVNECDERKRQHWQLLNNVLRGSVAAADHTVFVSAWLKETVLKDSETLTSHSSVIKSGADPLIFNPAGRAVWNGTEPLKIVTHHWSGSWHKGWDVYQALDDFLGTPEGQNYSFTFIGNPWPQAQLRHTSVLSPTSGSELANLLKQHHVYISASQNEPAGMHYIEALQCGLPIIWREGGSLGEYCHSRGVSFQRVSELSAALEKMRLTYSTWLNIKELSYTSDDMNKAYLELFHRVHSSAARQMTDLIFPLRWRQVLVWLRDSFA